MANVVLMPQVGITVESCVIGTWKKKVGDTVAVGDVLFDYETDKSAFDCESTADGVLLEIFAADGEEVPVLTPVCAVGNAGEDVSSLRPAGATAPAKAEAALAPPAGEEKASEPAKPAKAAVIDDGRPAATAVLMPQVGITVESCIIGSWKKKVGDSVAVGDVLFDYETDKSAFDCESTAAGTLLEIFFGDGEEVPVLKAVCAVGNVGDNVDIIRPDGAVAPAPAEEPAAAVKTEAAAAAVTVSEDQTRCFISPRAKHLAEEQHVDIRLAQPTGPRGRIIERDIRTAIDKGYISTGAAADSVAAAEAGKYSGSGIGSRICAADLSGTAAAAEEPAAIVKEVVKAAAEAAADYEDEKFSKIRAVISKSMKESLATIPQLTHNFSFDATNIKEYRARLKASGEELGASGITLGDMIMYAVSRIILKYPSLNANMLDDTHIRKFKHVNLGFACDTPRGLMVPVVKNADLKSLKEISDEVKELAKAARSGSLSPDKMSDGTFTVSNLGAYGVESFTPIINPPQTGILGVDTIVNRPVMKNGQIALYPAMGLSLTYDHRAVDGGPASKFVQELCKYLENFSVLLAI